MGTLPTRGAFLSELEVLSQCDICLQPFDKTDHVAVRTSCNHVFGRSCLTQWTRSKEEKANACPTCRTILFIKPLDVPDFPGNLGLLIHVELNATQCHYFINEIWKLLHSKISYSYMYDVVFENVLNTALNHLIRKDKIDFPRFLASRIPIVVAVLKDMVRAICGNPAKTELSSEECDETWTPRITAALGWVLRDEESDSIDENIASSDEEMD